MMRCFLICLRILIVEMAADPDAGMETCPSPEIPGDSRKRPLDSDTENGTTKRSHFSSGKLMILYTCTTYPYVCCLISKKVKSDKSK